MLNDPSNTYGVTAFAPSEIPQLDLLLEALARGHETTLSSTFEELDQILGSLYAIYLNELQFLAHDEPQNVAANQIALEFSQIRPLVAALRDELSLSDHEDALRTGRELKTALGRLFGSFGDLKHQALEGPRYSQLPFTQELLRVVHHYLKGNLALSAVQERLDAFCNYHDQLETQFEFMVPTPAEAPVFEARKDELEDALSLQLQGIEDLDVALERRSDQAIRMAVQTLKESADHLFDVYQALREADLKPATISCFRCGAENLAEHRLCSGCGAVLPRFESGLARSTIEIKESPGGVDATIPQELAQLQDAVDSALRQNDSAPLETTLAAFATRLAGITRQLRAMKEPPVDLPQDQVQLLEEGKARFRESLDILSGGHQLLVEGAPRLDAVLLRRGLEELAAGYHAMSGLQETFAEAENLDPKP